MSFFFDQSETKVAGSVADVAGDVLHTDPTALCDLETYWNALPKQNGIPMREAVSPTDLGDLISDCFVIERLGRGVARIRVAGQSIGRLIGSEPRGLPLTSLFVPPARTAMGHYIESCFRTPAILDLPIKGPRAFRQPQLQGRLMLLPLRDDAGEVTRAIGALVASGRRGVGGRRFDVCDSIAPRITPCAMLSAIDGGRNAPLIRHKAEPVAALRLVVSNG